MIEWPLLLAAGLLGSSHCLGMCGPFALAIGSESRNWTTSLARQLLYTLGRLFTYAVLGAIAGYGGARLSHFSETLVNTPAILALVAGALLCWQGLLAAGILRRQSRSRACVSASFFGSFLRQPGVSGVFLAGVFTGLLPCGLLYGTLALAASTHAVWKGMAVMGIFGLGTAPAMIAVGVSGAMVSIAVRRHVFTVAAWCLVLAGAISISRGITVLASPDRSSPACPLCLE